MNDLSAQPHPPDRPRVALLVDGENLSSSHATTAASVAEALSDIAARDPEARVLICGSLYLAGSVLRENA